MSVRMPLTRRDAMRLLGAGTGLGAVSRLQGEYDLLAWLQRGAGSQNVRFPRGAIIRTLLKDVSPEQLGSGATLFHEHLSINIPPASGARGGGAREGGPGAPGAAPAGAAPAAPGGAPAPAARAAAPAGTSPAPGAAAGQPPGGQDAGRGGRQGGPPLPPVTDDVEMIVQLVNRAASEGVSCIVDGGHRDMGTKLADLKTIAGRTKVHIVASGGFYMERTYPAFAALLRRAGIGEDTLHKILYDNPRRFLAFVPKKV